MSCTVTLEKEMNCPLCAVLCEESPYNLIDVLGPVSVIFQPWHFYKVEFTHASSAGKAARKIVTIYQS